MVILESILLVAALSLDAFVASLAFGAEKIRVPFSSALVIDLVCSGILGISLLLGQSALLLIPEKAAIIFSSIILATIGIARLCEGIIKALISKCCQNPDGIVFKLHNVKFFLQVCADSLKADSNHSKKLSPAEAISLATALSLDGLAAGFGAGMVQTKIALMITLSLVFNLGAVLAGCKIGRNLAEKTKLDLSWLAGIVLIILAIFKFL